MHAFVRACVCVCVCVWAIICRGLFIVFLIEGSTIFVAGYFNTLRMGLLNCLNARSRGLTFRHSAFCI